MNKNLKIEISKLDIVYYFIFIVFLHPRGFNEFFDEYKNFFTNLLYIAMVIIVLLFLYTLVGAKIRYKKVLYFVTAYYVIFIGCTFMLQGSISEGKQKLFAAPALFLVCLMLLRKNCKAFLRCLANTLIVLFVLNLTYFNPVYWEDYFSASGNHMIFLGHVQIASQLGILGVYVSYLLYHMGRKYKAGILLLLSLATMIMSETTVSHIALLVMAFAYLCSKIPGLRNKWLGLPSQWYIIFFVLLNIGLIWFTLSLKGHYRLYGWDISMSGRMFIWRQALLLISRNPWMGYGAYGALVRVFWSDWTGNGLGMNYTHNEMLQELLDGGIVLAVLFIFMLLAFAYGVTKVEDKAVKKWTNLFLVIWLLIMLAESVLGYYYIIIFLTLLVYLPEISSHFKKEGSVGEIT